MVETCEAASVAMRTMTTASRILLDASCMNAFVIPVLSCRYKEVLVMVETCEAASVAMRIKAPNVLAVASSLRGEGQVMQQCPCLCGVCGSGEGRGKGGGAGAGAGRCLGRARGLGGGGGVLGAVGGLGVGVVGWGVSGSVDGRLHGCGCECARARLCRHACMCASSVAGLVCVPVRCCGLRGATRAGILVQGTSYLI